MAILSEPNEIEFVITWVCNWRCEYCAVDTHHRPSMSMSEVQDKAVSIPDGSVVTLSGGEVGTMKRADVEWVITTLKNKDCSLRINTNGLFIKRYGDLLHHFDLVLYHCTENMELDREIIIDTTGANVEYLVIVTDNNFGNIGPFLDKYPSIEFHLVGSSMPEGISGPTLSQHMKYKMLTLYHSRMSTDSKRRVFQEKDFDAITYLQ